MPHDPVVPPQTGTGILPPSFMSTFRIYTWRMKPKSRHWGLAPALGVRFLGQPAAWLATSSARSSPADSSNGSMSDAASFLRGFGGVLRDRSLLNSSTVMGPMRRLRSWTAVLLAMNVLALWGLEVQAVQFELSSRTTKCIAEEIQSHVVVVGDYKIVHSDETHKVTVKLTSPYGNQLHYQENVQSGQFAFTTSESGNFMACFWILNAPADAVLNVALDWKTGVAAKDWASIAKKDKLDGMELELRKLEEAVDSIHSEMLYLREREAEMRDLNELTNSRVAWFGIMSLLVCLGVAGWQLWHLKTFFERKKLL